MLHSWVHGHAECCLLGFEVLGTSAVGQAQNGLLDVCDMTATIALGARGMVLACLDMWRLTKPRILIYRLCSGLSVPY
jgi:hypothetical protein